MTELKDVKGVGPKSLSLLNKININTRTKIVLKMTLVISFIESPILLLTKKGIHMHSLI